MKYVPNQKILIWGYASFYFWYKKMNAKLDQLCGLILSLGRAQDDCDKISASFMDWEKPK